MKVLVLFALATAVFSQQFAEYQLDISSEQGSVDLFEQWAAKFSKVAVMFVTMSLIK